MSRQIRNGVFYFPSWTAARDHAVAIGAPTNRILSFKYGWAIQWHASGPYVGPENKTHTGCAFCGPRELVQDGRKDPVRVLIEVQADEYDENIFAALMKVPTVRTVVEMQNDGIGGYVEDESTRLTREGVTR